MMVNLQWPLVIIGCFALLVSRTISVLVVSLIVNIFRTNKIPFSHQIVMSYGGLRGAVAFYLSLNINTEYKHLVIMTTICLIMFTIIGLGSTTTFLLQWLDKKFPEDKIIQGPEDEKLLSQDGKDDQGKQGGATYIENLDQHYGQAYLRRDERPGQEQEIRINLDLEEEDASEYSAAIDKDKEQLAAYFNRNTRGGDMSPFRTHDLQFSAQRKKDSVFGKYSGIGESPSMRNQLSTRKYSQGIEKRISDKPIDRPMETPKFAYTTKNIRGSGTGTFGELLKSKSEDVQQDVALSPSRNAAPAFLPKLTLEDADKIIDEEKSGEDSDHESPK